MGTCRVMAIFQGASNLPEDRFINTFHFHEPSPDVYDVYAAECADAVGDFYMASHSSAHVGQFLSAYVNRDWQMQTYDLTVPEGEREPTIFTRTLAASSGDSLPEETAVCLTLHGEPPITPRRRGRLYIGPLRSSSQILTQPTGVDPCRVTLSSAQAIGLVLGQAAADLMENVDVTWCVRSITPTENFVPITGGWVDNAFDVIRKRGPDPTGRRNWDASDAGVT